MFSLKELEENFSIDGISKSPSIFDYSKLEWFNGEYIRSKTLEEFTALAMPYYKEVMGDKELDWTILSSILQPRVTRLTQIPEMIRFFQELPEYDAGLFVNKKSKTTLENSGPVLQMVIDGLEGLSQWNQEGIHDFLIGLAQDKELKNGTVMWPARIAASGMAVTPGGAVEILAILGREEALRRLKLGLEKLQRR